MEKRLFLLDAFALIFRAYYALIRNPRITSKGKNTNAQFGFTNALVDLINKQKPSHMAICFDTAAPTERHTDFADYKANRQEAPELAHRTRCEDRRRCKIAQSLAGLSRVGRDFSLGDHKGPRATACCCDVR